MTQQDNHPSTWPHVRAYPAVAGSEVWLVSDDGRLGQTWPADVHAALHGPVADVNLALARAQHRAGRAA